MNIEFEKMLKEFKEAIAKAEELIKKDIKAFVALNLNKQQTKEK